MMARTKREAWESFMEKRMSKPITNITPRYCVGCGQYEAFEQEAYCSLCLIGKARDAERLEGESYKWQARFILLFMLLIGAIVIYFLGLWKID